MIDLLIHYAETIKKEYKNGDYVGCLADLNVMRSIIDDLEQTYTKKMESCQYEAERKEAQR